MYDSALACNGHVRFDGRSGGGASTVKQLVRRQNLYARLVYEFRSERILNAAFDMASELRLGLLDVFGSAGGASKARGAQPADDQTIDSLRASNCVFVETLLDSSTHFGTSGSTAACHRFAGDNDAKPLSRAVGGRKGNECFGDLIYHSLKTIHEAASVKPKDMRPSPQIPLSNGSAFGSPSSLSGNVTDLLPMVVG